MEYYKPQFKEFGIGFSFEYRLIENPYLMDNTLYANIEYWTDYTVDENTLLDKVKEAIENNQIRVKCLDTDDFCSLKFKLAKHLPNDEKLFFNTDFLNFRNLVIKFDEKYNKCVIYKISINNAIKYLASTDDAVKQDYEDWLNVDKTFLSPNYIEEQLLSSYYDRILESKHMVFLGSIYNKYELEKIIKKV
tara:strand:+ start:735 stop:1307 length:573 start_codon:yes stop_codon:yes gene_type:complete